jgi:transcriptional regulator with PAS, ATPase and Fis domain
MPDALVQSELFGYAPGAFTGADPRGRPGLFEKASGGAVFLDEIGELPLRHQVNLLRVLEERAVTRVGAHDSRPVDVKVIAATNRDLAREVSAGLFREDLFHRLNVMAVNIPPLRDRPEDVMPVARFHLARLAGEMGIPPPELGREASELFLSHPWPGNARTLVNALEYACNRYFLEPFTQIGLEHLPPSLTAERPAPAPSPSTSGEARQAPTPSGAPRPEPSAPGAARSSAVKADENTEAHEAPLSFGETDRFADAERQILVRALSENNYNITRTAKSLGVCRNTLYAMLSRHDISLKRL